MTKMIIATYHCAILFFYCPYAIRARLKETKRISVVKMSNLFNISVLKGYNRYTIVAYTNKIEDIINALAFMS